MKKGGFSVRSRFQSFRYAFEGIISLFRNEPNAVIHIVATVFAIILGFILSINETEWLLIIIVIGLVFITELINSAIEKIADIINPGINPEIKKVKDFAAAAVLVAAVIALITGILIFIPKL